MCSEKSGVQIENNASGCADYGERAVITETEIQKQSRMVLQKVTSPLGLVAGAVVIVVLIVLLINGGGYKRALNNYYKAYENNDVELMYNSVWAQYWVEYVYVTRGSSAHMYMQSNMEDTIDGWYCGDNINITYKIKDKRRATKEELVGLESNIYEWYAYCAYERDEFSITDAYVLDIDFTVKGDRGTDNFYYPDGLLVIKENGKWRIAKGAINCSFYNNQ